MRAPPVLNIRADVIWALRGHAGGLTVEELAAKIAVNRGARYPEIKIEGVLDALIGSRQVQKVESEGRILYCWGELIE